MTSNRLFNLTNVSIALLVVVVDLAIYIMLGLLLMNYEDFYDESQGPYWSWESMETLDRVAYVAWHIWVTLNVVLLLYSVYRVYCNVKRGQCKPLSPPQ